MKWVSVKNKMPKIKESDSKSVECMFLWLYDGEKVMPALMRHEQQMHFEIKQRGITHWMHMRNYPLPPKMK